MQLPTRRGQCRDDQVKLQRGSRPVLKQQLRAVLVAATGEGHGKCFEDVSGLHPETAHGTIELTGGHCPVAYYLGVFVARVEQLFQLRVV